MTFGDFIKEKEKIDEALSKCVLKYGEKEIYTYYYPGNDHEYQYDVSHAQLTYENKTVDLTLPFISDRYRDNWYLFLQLRALDKISNLFENISPFDYVQLLEYYNEIVPVQILYTDPDIKTPLQLLQKYLDKDYEVPEEVKKSIDRSREIYLSRNLDELTVKDWYDFTSFDLNKLSLHSCFCFGKRTDFIAQESAKIYEDVIRYKVEHSKSQEPHEPLLVARIMSEDELNNFKKYGVVTPLQVSTDRVWDSYNEGAAGCYTFMVMRNKKDALFNLSTVLPFMVDKYEEDDDEYYYEPKSEKSNNLKLVFFETNSVTEDMIYFSGYQGMQIVDPYYDFDGLYGQDKSREISVPFYHQQNYKIVKESDITLDNIYDITVKSLNDLGVLTSIQTEEVTPTEVYKNFKHAMEDEEISYESILNTVKNFIEFCKYSDPKYFEKIDNLDEEVDNFAMNLKRDYKLNDIETLKIEGDMLQKILYWEYLEPRPDFYYDEYDEYGDDEYDEEYDEDHEYSNGENDNERGNKDIGDNLIKEDDLKEALSTPERNAKRSEAKNVLDGLRQQQVQEENTIQSQ